MNLNKRTQTKHDFYQAFWALYFKQSIREITVGSICKSAGYSRTTFYEYFVDVYDLLDQAENNLLEQFMEDLEPYIIFKKKIDEVSLMMIEGFSTAYLHQEKYLSRLLSADGDAGFPHKMTVCIQKRFADSFLKYDPSYQQLMEYTLLALLTVINQWSLDGHPLPIELILKTFATAVKAGHASLEQRS